MWRRNVPVAVDQPSASTLNFAAVWGPSRRSTSHPLSWAANCHDDTVTTLRYNASDSAGNQISRQSRHRIRW